MIIDGEFEKKMGLGPYTEKQGKTMLGAEAIIASLEAEGVDTVLVILGVRLSRFMMRSMIRKKSPMFLLVMSRVQHMKLMGMLVLREKQVLLL